MCTFEILSSIPEILSSIFNKINPDIIIDNISSICLSSSNMFRDVQNCLAYVRQVRIHRTQSLHILRFLSHLESLRIDRDYVLDNSIHLPSLSTISDLNLLSSTVESVISSGIKFPNVRVLTIRMINPHIDQHILDIDQSLFPDVRDLSICSNLLINVDEFEHLSRLSIYGPPLPHSYLDKINKSKIEYLYLGVNGYYGQNGTLCPPNLRYLDLSYYDCIWNLGDGIDYIRMNGVSHRTLSKTVRHSRYLEIVDCVSGKISSDLYPNLDSITIIRVENYTINLEHSSKTVRYDSEFRCGRLYKLTRINSDRQRANILDYPRFDVKKMI